MTFSEISNILDNVVNQWLASIDDEGLRNRFAENVLLAGGSIGSLIRNETPNDYDIFFRNQNTVNLVSDYYEQYNDSGNFRIITITENAVTFENGIQLILKYSGKLEQLWNNFDFRHTKIGFDYRTKLIQYDNQTVLDDIRNKEVFYDDFDSNLRNLDLTLKRVIKRINEGWSVNTSSYLTLLKRYSEKGGDLNKYKELTTFIIQNDV
jgi:hypothetical protein